MDSSKSGEDTLAFHGSSVEKLTRVAPVSSLILLSVKEDTGATLVNFSTDDPWNARVSSPDLLESIPCYDLYCTVRRAALPDIHRAGCPRAEHVLCGFHPHLHFPPSVPVTPTIAAIVVGG